MLVVQFSYVLKLSREVLPALVLSSSFKSALGFFTFGISRELTIKSTLFLGVWKTYWLQL